MKLKDLQDKDLSNKIINLNEENLRSFFKENDLNISSLYGNRVFNYTFYNGRYFLLGESVSFGSLREMINFINENNNEIVDVILKEELSFVKFRYRSKYPDKGYQIHDKKPKVIVLDNDYCWRNGKKDPNRHDVLAFNLHYSDKAKIDKKAVDEITTFAYMLKKNDKDVYKRIKEFYPEIIKYIRCYKPERMTKIKKKDGWVWKQASVVDLAPADKDFSL